MLAVLPGISWEALLRSWNCATSDSISKLWVREEMEEQPKQALVQSVRQRGKAFAFWGQP